MEQPTPTEIRVPQRRSFRVPGLGVRFKPAESLSEAERAAMFAIRGGNMTRVEQADDALDRGKFDAALEGCVVVLMADRSGDLGAYYLAYDYIIDSSSGSSTVLYGRYLHASPGFRGRASLYLSGVIYGLRYAVEAVRGRLYMAGPYLPNSYIFTQRITRMWCLQDADLSPDLGAILGRLGSQVGGSGFDPVRGTVTGTARSAPRKTHSETAARLLARYETFNPDWQDGTALLCVGRITPGVLLRAVQVAVQRSLGRRSAARRLDA